MAKTQFALVNGDNEIIRLEAFEPAWREKQGDPIGKGWRWVPVAEIADAHDPATERLVDTGVKMQQDGTVARVLKAETKPTPPITAEMRFAKIEARLDKLEGK